jgi:hypothetical protein
MEERVITGNAVKVTFSSLSWRPRFLGCSSSLQPYGSRRYQRLTGAPVLARCERDTVSGESPPAAALEDFFLGLKEIAQTNSLPQ